jgi:ABC-type transport system involved in multi-copper enzyme maturation permease subunit
MYKALIWKEYRETIMPLAATVLGCSILSWIFYLLSDQTYYYGTTDSLYLYSLFYVVSASLIALYAIMAGAEAFASEYQTNTFDFLVSRAISRGKLWYCKFVFRVFTLLLSIAVYFLFTLVLMRPREINIEHQCIFVISVLIMFSASFFFSTILNRAVKAGATGLVIYLAYAMLFMHFSDNLLIFIITSVILTALLLTASFFIFTRDKLSRAV